MPSRSTRAHLPITARTKPSSTKERCLFCPCGEILEQTSSTPILGNLRFHLTKTVGPPLVRNLPCSTCVTSVPIHLQFSQYCYHRLLMFSLNTRSPPLICGYYWPSWPFLPLINKLINLSVFGHRAMLIWGDRGMAMGLFIKQTEPLQIRPIATTQACNNY